MHLRPHRSIIEEGALAPLHHRFRIKIVAAGELLDRSLRSLYSSSDGVRGLGAAVKNLSHRASRNVASAWLIPRHSGTAQLGSRKSGRLAGFRHGLENADAMVMTVETAGDLIRLPAGLTAASESSR